MNKDCLDFEMMKISENGWIISEKYVNEKAYLDLNKMIDQIKN